MIFLWSKWYPPEGADPLIYIPMVVIVFLILLIIGIRSGSLYK